METTASRMNVECRGIDKPDCRRDKELSEPQTLNNRHRAQANLHFQGIGDSKVKVRRTT